MDYHIEEILHKKIKEKKDIYLKNIIRGHLTPEEYKFTCGKLHGLEEAENLFKEFIGTTIEERITVR